MSQADTPLSLPEEVLEAAVARTGWPVRVARLGGMSGRTVARVHGDAGSVVAKGPVLEREAGAARWLAEPLARYGVRTVRVFSVLDTGRTGTWIVMEYLAAALPRERWGSDIEVIATLRAMHQVPRGTVANLAHRYRPKWDDATTVDAGRALGTDRVLIHRLTELAERAQPLFEEQNAIVGDPNPLNWRLDEDGHPVLVDLERLTVATPAIDLAIVMPGLPDRESAAEMIRRYGAGVVKVDDVLLAKAWSVVELAATAPHGSPASHVVTQIRASFLSWLGQIGPGRSGRHTPS